MQGADQLQFEFKPVVIPRGDGSFIVRPGKMVVKKEEITVSEAAAVLGVSPWTIHNYIRDGLLDARQNRPNSMYRVKRESVDKMLTRELV